MKLKIQNLEHLQGRIGIFGDLHGVWNETVYAINDLRLDWVILLGDISDRGPQVFELYRLVMNNANYFCVMGNHDHKLLRYLQGDKVGLNPGFMVTLSQLANNPSIDQQELAAYIESMPHIIKLPRRMIAVHAGLDPTKSLEGQDWKTCLKIRSFNPKQENLLNNSKDPRWFEYSSPTFSKYRIAFGHSQFDRIEVKSNIYALDGGAVYGNELRVMVLDTSTSCESFHTYPCNMYYKKTHHS